MSGFVLRRIARIAVLVLALAGLSAILQHIIQAESGSNAPYSVTLEEARRFPNVLWVDARSRPAYEAGHIPRAVLLNAAEWEDLASPFLDAWDPDVPVIVYCDSESCNASSAIAERLRNEMGIDNVFVLQGGWETWKKAHP